MILLSGKQIAEQINRHTELLCRAFSERFSSKPCLAVILVGENPSGRTYVNTKRKLCDLIGIESRLYEFDSSVTQKQLTDKVKSLNEDRCVDGILVQLPLPSHADESAVIDVIDPGKDVDGFTPQNMGKLLLGGGRLISCTPKGILRLLDAYDIPVQSKSVCVIGRSNIVGKPVAALLLQRDRNATVMICHSFTDDVSRYTEKADIVIVAAGCPGLVTGNMIKEGSVVIDVGITRIPDSTKKSGFRLAGDVDFDSAVRKCSAITPVPGGVGPMTVAMLMENTVIAACARRGITDCEELLH